MSKILIKDKEVYFIDSIYDLHQLVDDDTYDLILELVEDEKDEQCEKCNYCDPDCIDDYEEEYDECVATLTNVYDLLEEIKDNKFDDDGVNKRIDEMMKDIKWNLR